MASSLPTPIRIAAGLVGTTLDRLGTLPQELPGLGVSLVGQAFRVSLRVRQELAALAVRGDDLLAGVGGGGETDQPAWATFDEDTETSAAPTAPPPPPAGAAKPGADEPFPTDTGTGTGTGSPRRRTPPRRPSTPKSAAPHPAPTAVAADPADLVLPANSFGAPANTPEPFSPPPDLIVVETVLPDPAADPLSRTTSALRDHLAELGESEVAQLLSREESGAARPAYLTLIGNRLTTLRATPGR